MSSRSPNKIKIQYKVKKQLNPNNMANILKYIEGSKSNRINKVKENIDFSIKNDRLKEIFN